MPVIAQHPDCTLTAEECRIVEAGHSMAVVPAWTAVYDGYGVLVTPDPTVSQEDFSCLTCARNWRVSTDSLGVMTTTQLPTRQLPPVNIDVPYAEQRGATLNCTMGNWAGEPNSYDYEWVRDGTTRVAMGPDHSITADDVGQSLACTLIAANAGGASAPVTSNAVVVTRPVA
jgi:hypothetical protein